MVLLMAVWLASPAGSATDPAVKCSAAKLKAAGRKANGKLKCYARATLEGLADDQTCVDKIEAKFNSAWQRIEAAGGCRASADQTSVETTVDILARGLFVGLAPCGDLGG